MFGTEFIFGKVRIFVPLGVDSTRTLKGREKALTCLQAVGGLLSPSTQGVLL